MAIQEDLNRAEHGLRLLEHAAVGLRAHLGADLDALRLVDDISRCREDIARLRTHSRVPRQVTDEDLIVIPDGDYDTALWDGGDFDAEGLGVPGRRAP